MEPLFFHADQVIYCDDASKWFDHYMPLIPNNAIIHKTITGIGATTTEITSKRNSIIVLPNVSTIHNKYHRHKDDNEDYTVFPVYEGVTDKHIAEYLKSNKKFKKILTTPESLHKVRGAFKQAKIQGTSQFFILMDEAHKYIQDNGYRPMITKAMDSFFEFLDKAMVSSTPIKPSDPRFAEFSFIKLQPTFNYAKPVELIDHNNVLFALKNIFKQGSGLKQCVFFNSINGIVDIVRKLGIGHLSSIFCSKESAQYLRTLSYADGSFFKAYDQFNADAMGQYNFFTSSLFNGLDIILDEPPQVSMVSIPNDPKTYLDPFTDIVQILGRFRKSEMNPTGYHGNAVHLVETSYNDNYKSREEVTIWLNANQQVYENIMALMHSCIKLNEFEIYREALKRMLFHKYLANDLHLSWNNSNNFHSATNQGSEKLSFDYFKRDNLYEDERVKSYYCNPAYLWQAYQIAGLTKASDNECKLFDFSTNYNYAPVKGQPKLNLKSGKRYSKENIRQLVAHLCDLDSIAGEEYYYDVITFEITENYPLVRLAFNKLGRDKIAELDYRIGKIRQALIDYDVKWGKNHHPVIDSIYLTLPMGVKLSLPKIKNELQKIYDHYKIRAIAKASDIKQWYEVKEVKILTYKISDAAVTNTKHESNEQRGYILLKQKFNLHRELLRT